MDITNSMMPGMPTQQASPIPMHSQGSFRQPAPQPQQSQMNPMLAQALAQFRPDGQTQPSVSQAAQAQQGMTLEEQLALVRQNDDLKAQLSSLRQQLYGGPNV